MNILYILLLIIFIFFLAYIVIFIIRKLNNKVIIESFSDECNDFFDKNSFCQVNIDLKKCECKLQKDTVKYAFDSPEVCCKRNCNKRTIEECVQDKKETGIPYYCNINGSCVEYKGTILSNHISANNCGVDSLNNQLLLPYATKEECKKSVNICDKYNVPSRAKEINKQECLKDVYCGYCTNSEGNGKCIEGNATNPTDLRNYYFCTANQTNGKNSYEYGNHVAYLLQE